MLGRDKGYYRISKRYSFCESLGNKGPV